MAAPQQPLHIPLAARTLPEPGSATSEAVAWANVIDAAAQLCAPVPDPALPSGTCVALRWRQLKDSVAPLLGYVVGAVPPTPVVQMLVAHTYHAGGHASVEVDDEGIRIDPLVPIKAAPPRRRSRVPLPLPPAVATALEQLVQRRTAAAALLALEEQRPAKRARLV